MVEIHTCICLVSGWLWLVQAAMWHLDVAVQNLVLSGVALMQSASELEENAPNLMLFHLLARALVLADDSSEISVFAKFHDDINCGCLAVDDAVLSKRHIMFQQMKHRCMQLARFCIYHDAYRRCFSSREDDITSMVASICQTYILQSACLTLYRTILGCLSSRRMLTSLTSIDFSFSFMRP
jgi:hypothetical protein